MDLTTLPFVHVHYCEEKKSRIRNKAKAAPERRDPVDNQKRQLFAFIILGMGLGQSSSVVVLQMAPQ